MVHRNITFIVLLMAMIFPASSYAQDWADLNRFKEANSKLKTPTTDKNRIVFMGNSITIGWQSADPDFFANPAYVNRGISGQTTPQMLVRFRQDVIALQPKVVVILAGTNDIAGNTGPSTIEMIRDNIISMSQLAKANGIKVVLCSVVPAFDYPWKPGLEPAPKIVALNQLIKTYADANDIVYVDYFSAMADARNGLRKDLGDDGVHPNKKGYDIMKPLALKAIEKALGNN
ncbi:SGNH/GDSL hydrolase family protein [Arenibacter sp. GZD96]|uniref:SGNH/GDSL hydrolase family protein n=1 Tax=Aurantibrevibacter litoralis TaxID=3106030 RepID=UPI002AFE2BCF|nr:SGNH/GDSL hydrolase family protein [Arenibacter sp. GZD-96]MEA1787486.1 SGNH/GDSL hydrolase family protein [Arenibacter sp. GZD-96]